VSCYVAAAAIERDDPGAETAAADPALWREIRRFNLPVKLALVAAQRALAALAEPSRATLIALAPCRSGSAEQRAALGEGSAIFARGAAAKLRVNPIHTLHGVDNLALSALSMRLSNREPCACLGGAAGQAWLGLEQAIDELAAGGAGARTGEILVFGGDQGEASLRGEAADPEACGVAIALTARPARARIVEIERAGGAGGAARPHAARGLARWLDALAAAPAGRFAYRVPAEDGDGVDALTVIAEVA
jgi:hypothetical protein